MKHSTAGSMLCSERIAGTPVAVYFIFAGESLGWVWLPCICLKSTGYMVFHLILLRSNYSCYASCLFSSLHASLMLPTYLICTTGPFLPFTGLTSDFAAI